MSTQRDLDPIKQELHALRTEVQALRQNRKLYEANAQERREEIAKLKREAQMLGWMRRQAGDVTLVYLAHRLAGDIEANLRSARVIRYRLRKEYEHTHCIIAPWISEAEQFDDADPGQRERGLQRCLEVISRCDELWLTGPLVSEGMQRERDFAEAFGIRVVDMTDQCCLGGKLRMQGSVGG